eukprot:CAMPEP_0184486550 /NCGR_PEP_ID=MMETSP0113_2-20130426/8031_1 /TAXON_ID=91329 /ORGANISM="Norrisiella sphaerica, Strain BC52" /LENGTH=472 /DNA_ID=CAMNT_0026868477 /DNA_START=287 /DNA_END=1705 /DNA_ORIENTATION=+
MEEDTSFQVYWMDATNLIVSGVITNVTHVKAMGKIPQYYNIQTRSYCSSGKQFFPVLQSRCIYDFDGSVPIDQLPLRRLSTEGKLYKQLTERGRRYAQLSKGVHHMHYNGHLMKRGFFIRRLRANGRLMIDHASFSQFQPNHYMTNLGRQFGVWNHTNGIQYDTGRGNNLIDEVEEKLLCTCWPTVLVFSLRAKTWGEASIDEIEEIQFHKDSFSKLVRPKKEKALIQTLVRQTFHTSETSGLIQGKLAKTDFISGKGGGAVFLLHGNPGTGKTLTAESLAEMMERPLYIVSVGELGTTASILEQNLNQILELASIWKAIILLDEADVFLEKRTINDIHRCALVGVFLRMLEYHDGIIFLTTNRVQCFDPAFKSRISMSLHYEDLNDAGRATVWKNISQAMAKTDELSGNLDFKVLGQKYELNGRQIRSCLRLAKALAENDSNKVVTMSHIDETAKIVQSLDTMGHGGDEKG